MARPVFLLVMLLDVNVPEFLGTKCFVAFPLLELI
jgi:hypothetical protein